MDEHEFKITLRADQKLSREFLRFLLQDVLDDIRCPNDVADVKVIDPEAD